MMTKNDSAQFHQIDETITDAELDTVTGGDKATTTTKKPPTTTKPLVITLEQVFISSY